MASRRPDMTPEQIDAAETAGIISKDQAVSMRAKDSVENEAMIGDENDLRFIRGFSDVFISAGLIIFLLGASAMTGLMGGGALFLATALGAWVASEYFARKKRAHLPTLVLAISFLLCVQRGVAGILPGSAGAPELLGAFVTFGAMALYYVRFRFPFCIALLAWSGVGIVFALLGHNAASIFDRGFSAGLIGCGLVTFIAGVLYDMKDIGRTTRFSDNAFWLHLTAAPMVIHGIALSTLRVEKTNVMGLVNIPDLSGMNAGLMLIVIGILCLVALAINRRALIGSSLGYAGFSIAFLMKDAGLGFSNVVVLTLLLLGGGIILLGIGWNFARKGVLKFLPRRGVFAKLFPPVTG